MIQTQTLAIDNETRIELRRLSELIAEHRANPERLRELIEQHDDIVKHAPMKLYNQSEDHK